MNLACPKCSKALSKNELDSMYKCNTCFASFQIYKVNGFEIIDFVSNDLDFTAGFSSADDMLNFNKLLSIFDKTDFYGLVKIYQTLSSHNNDFLTIKIPEPESLSAYDLNHGKDSLGKAKSIAKKINKKINFDGVALENGSGYGFFTYEFAKKFKELYVADCSMCYLLLGIKFIAQNEKMSSEHDALIKKVSFLRCNIEKLPIQENSINFIHSNNAIEHVSNQQKYLEEMNRVVKEDFGLVYIVSPNRYSALAEPHYGLRFFGLYPNFLASFLIRNQSRPPIDDVIPLSLISLRKKLKTIFQENFIILGVFKDLRIANQTRLKSFILHLNKLNFINYLLNNILIHILPGHYVLASKKNCK